MSSTPLIRPLHLIFPVAIALSLGACTSTQGNKTKAGLVEDRRAALAQTLTEADLASASGLKTAADQQRYNTATEKAVVIWMTLIEEASRNKSVEVTGAGRSWRLQASWPEGLRFDELVRPTPPEKQPLNRIVLREGVGAPFVARWRHTDERKKQEPFLSEEGYLVPVTVTLDFRNDGKGSRKAELRVHDPNAEETAVIAGRTRPLAANFSAVSEYILTQTQKKDTGMSGMGALRHSDKYLDKLGLIALEPPARDRIPVIFVHGLMSRPLTWHNAFNELGADPTIRKNYQIYFFRYPSGVPVIYSAAKFRAQLSLLAQELNRIGNDRAAHHMVLIGHSMGGLVSKLQLQSSGDRFWVNVFGAKPADLGLSKEEVESFHQYLEFNPNPNVDRVIFVSTPHRGSTLAEGFIGAVGRRLVSLPGRVLGNTFGLLKSEAPRNPIVQQLLKKGVPSSIDNLSPKSVFVKESIQIPLKPGLHVHSIIGNKDGRPLTDPKCTDGVVPYSSAHLDGVESEFVLRSDHGAHEHPEAIAEMRRILLLHLKTVRSQ